MRLCRIFMVLFALLWVLALVELAIGTFGLFGQERDPLSGVYLVVLGAPWIQLAGSGGPAAAVLAPGVNLLILLLICRWFDRRKQ